ncbi:Monoamine oxidase [Streptomyces venezuelae]|uniref:flavin monoamine oxidase family protein n=1 Tax=Streptomyces gardneri TaxID=66892 RepID=UPI0006BD929C|nr:FAD-dependent oxidoreductase [Streptomyces gardneri]ALO06036.1 Monoamine oxidase [Streptomyces venezuelae]QPK43532.1 FAD-dependent oxidoreductase [Streptomyces gardneri]WRK34768.1 FAD-dependent oxidoreductase [Streptomyces venezuelae]CUM43734.1 Flavin monoamine oxidase-related protein [Streptomyces venezuelae]
MTSSKYEKNQQALYDAMIGVAGPAATGWTGPPRLPRPARQGESVLILGAGVAGLTAAYELSVLGYDCTVLEATERVGGRNRTARGGDELYEVDDGTGAAVRTHTCRFDEGLYVNLGPGRIPHHHRRVLSYCRAFGVALEPYVMETTANLVRPPHLAAALPNRRVANDTRGHIAAMLAEALEANDAFTDEVRDLLRVFGALDVDGKYTVAPRSGYLHDPSAGDPFPEPAPPLTFEELVESGFWKTRFYQPLDHEWQPTMFQPVGGMDRIVEALAHRAGLAGTRIVLGAEVTGIALGEAGPGARPGIRSDIRPGVRVSYRKGGQPLRADARHCVSSIPVPVLKGVRRSGFSEAFESAVDVVEFAKTCKVGWQAERRFWEDDPADASGGAGHIYGGISWTSHDITQLWYPSHGYFSDKGTLTGAYNFTEKADRFGRLPIRERLDLAREGAADLHPEFADDELVPQDKGVTIAWHKVPYQLGGWADWKPDREDHRAAYRQLLQPEGDAFHMTGDQISPLPGWQEGAMMSAQYVVQQILGVMPRAVPEVITVPDSAALTQGMI